MKDKITIVRSIYILTILSFLSIGLQPLKGQIHPDSGKSLPDFVVFLNGAEFIPFSESYRINYHTNLARLPFEFAGGLCFPVNSTLSGMVEFRYIRRVAVYVPNLRIKTLQIQLGARDYLEKEHENDLRLYGEVGLLLAQATTSGTIEATKDGKTILPTEVSKDYFNIGLGLGLGIEYPLTRISALSFGIHIGIYFADPIAGGGLGNIGGLSVELGYRWTLWD